MDDENASFVVQSISVQYMYHGCLRGGCTLFGWGSFDVSSLLLQKRKTRSMYGTVVWTYVVLGQSHAHTCYHSWDPPSSLFPESILFSSFRNNFHSTLVAFLLRNVVHDSSSVRSSLRGKRDQKKNLSNLSVTSCVPHLCILRLNRYPIPSGTNIPVGTAKSHQSTFTGLCLSFLGLLSMSQFQ